MELNKVHTSLLESVGSVGFENSSVSALTGSTGGSEDGEFETVFSEQVRSGSSDFILTVENDGSND